MTAWDITAYVSIVVFVLLIAFLSIMRFRKNIYYKEYKPDDLFETSLDYNTKNSYYLVCNESRDFIKRYVIRKSTYERSLICNFTKKFGFISYFVVSYGFHDKVISVKHVIEKNTNLSSKIIRIPSGAKKINIFVQRADGVELNSNIIKPISKRNIALYSIFSSLALFTGLYAIRHFALMLILSKYFRPYLDTPWNFLGVILIGIIAIVYLIISIISLTVKNTRNRRGGALEYEFF